MSSNEPAVRAILSSLAAKVESCTTPFDTQAVAKFLHGLNSASSKSEEARAMPRVLILKKEDCNDKLTAGSMVKCLNGLQNIKNDNPEVLTVPSLVCAKITESAPHLHHISVGNALYGV